MNVFRMQHLILRLVRLLLLYLPLSWRQCEVTAFALALSSASSSTGYHFRPNRRPFKNDKNLYKLNLSSSNRNNDNDNGNGTNGASSLFQPGQEDTLLNGERTRTLDLPTNTIDAEFETKLNSREKTGDPEPSNQFNGDYARTNSNNSINNNDQGKTDKTIQNSISSSSSWSLDRLPSFVRPEDHKRLQWKKRILQYRSYARDDAFRENNLERRPAMLEDLQIIKLTSKSTFLVSIPGTLLTTAIFSLVFPLIAGNLMNLIQMPPEQLDAITSKFAPGVAFFYGTFISLTLSILYRRQQTIQDSVAKETALLGYLLDNMVVLLRGKTNKDRQLLIQAAQYTADQVQILLRESRGGEYMSIVTNDPYRKIQCLIGEKEERLVEEHGDFLSKGPVLSACRDALKDLRTERALRLSAEAMALPPTHFLILSALTFLLLLGFVISVMPAIEVLKYVPVESSVLFGILSSLHFFFYQVADDLNDPYTGVFQVQRGSSACHLLEIRQIVLEHPVLREEVSFESLNKEVEENHPELANVWFDSK